MIGGARPLPAPLSPPLYAPVHLLKENTMEKGRGTEEEK